MLTIVPFLSFIEFTEPVGAPNLAQFCLVDMYTNVTHKLMQLRFHSSLLSKGDAPLRIAICTIAFGMGIDCVDVCQVIHWGPSSDVESNIQECGRAGHNCQPANT